MVLDLETDPRHLDLQDPEFKFEEPVRGKVKFKLIGQRVLAEGTLNTDAVTTCSRCLRDVRIIINTDIRVMYENNPELLKPEIEFLGSEDDFIAYYDGDQITPEPQLREAIMADLPSRPLCDEACKGLCPKCGANMNEEPCECHIEPSKEPPSWKSAIKNLKLGDSD
jgi:uncharacterized protein